MSVTALDANRIDQAVAAWAEKEAAIIGLKPDPRLDMQAIALSFLYSKEAFRAGLVISYPPCAEEDCR